MKKRFLSLLCVLALCLGLLPVTALAAEEIKLFIGGQQITESGCYANQNGTWTKVEGTGPSSGQFYYDAATFTLTLNQAEITHDQTVKVAEGYTYEGSVIAFSQTADVSLKIVVSQGTSTITGTGGIRVESTTGNASLSIKGSGSLDVEPKGSNSGITLCSSKNTNLDIDGADVTASSPAQYGVYLISSTDATSTSTITVNNGSLTTGGNGNVGIYYYWSGTSNAGTSSLTVSGNAVVDTRNSQIMAQNKETVVQVGAGSNGNGGIVFNGKSGTVYGDVTLQEDLEIGNDETLTIGKDASLTVPDGKTLTNNGTINVESGGKLEGTTTGNGTLKIAPTITTQPQDVEVKENETATFTVKVTGTEPLSYQWQQSTDNGSNWTDITGETNATYTTGKTTMDMNGTQYRCVVKNSIDEVISDAATLTVTAKPAYTVTVNANPTEGGTANADRQTAAEAETVTLTATPNSNYRFVGWTSDGGVTFADASSPSTTFTMPAGDVTITANWQYDPPYIPPTKTPSEQALDKIEDAKPGDTVTISIFGGNTKLDKEVFEKLAGQDITLVVKLPCGVSWTVHGKDIPKNANITDIDMGVSLNTSTIPVDVLNMVTGEIGTVQMTLKHNGAFGFTMTMIAPLGTENKGLWANLYHYDETAGKMTFETAAKVNADGNVSLPFTHASAYAIILDEKSHELPFTDTVKGAWYQGAVEYVYRNDIMNGVSETTFKPNTALSRAMVAQILYNLEGQPAVEGQSAFTDVRGHWAASPIAWAQETGVVNGYEDNTFRPDRAVSREELAQMLYNYTKYKDYDLTATGDLTVFPDGDDVSDWAETAMEWANGMGLINGFEDDTLLPGGTATRAQAASILMCFEVNLSR